jgi:hypothetical protein
MVGDLCLGLIFRKEKSFKKISKSFGELEKSITFAAA